MNKNIFQRLTIPVCCSAFALSAIAVGLSGRNMTISGVAHAADSASYSAQGTIFPAYTDKMQELDEIIAMQTQLLATDVTVIPDSDFRTFHYEPVYLVDNATPLGTIDLSPVEMPTYPVGDEENILDMEYPDFDAFDVDAQLISKLVSDDTIHFNPSDITEPSNMSRADIEDFVERRCSFWLADSGIIDHLMDIDSEINLVFLLAVARTETGAGEVCVGWHNSFNVRNADGTYTDYWSYTESIDDFVNLILTQYIDSEGDWHEGTSIDSINIHYAESPIWSEYVTNIGYEILDRYTAE